jgi:hypothetical protein
LQDANHVPAGTLEILHNNVSCSVNFIILHWA